MESSFRLALEKSEDDMNVSGFTDHRETLNFESNTDTESKGSNSDNQITDCKKTIEDLHQTIKELANENKEISRQLHEEKEIQKQVVSELKTETNCLAAKMSVLNEAIQQILGSVDEKSEDFCTSTPLKATSKRKNKSLNFDENFNKSITDCKNKNNKFDVTQIDQTLNELEKTFKKKREAANMLITSAKRSIKSSLTTLESLNSSEFDSFDVTAINDKMEHLQKELDLMKKNHANLVNAYKEKSIQVQNMANYCSTPAKNSSTPKKNRPSLTEKTIAFDTFQQQLNDYGNDLRDLKLSIVNIKNTLNNYVINKSNVTEKILSLKLTNTQLKQEHTDAKIATLDQSLKIKFLEHQIAMLREQINKKQLKRVSKHKDCNSNIPR